MTTWSRGSVGCRSSSPDRGLVTPPGEGAAGNHPFRSFVAPGGPGPSTPAATPPSGVTRARPASPPPGSAPPAPDRQDVLVLPHEHLESLSQLSPEAADELGPLLSRLSAALETVTGCAKAYVLFLAEAEGYSHVHLHVVPRMPDQPPEERGPRIFRRLGVPASECVPTADMDALAARIADQLRLPHRNG